MRKIIALVTLVTLLATLTSCVSYTKDLISMEKIAKKSPRRYKILSVSDKSHKWWEFEKPAKFVLGKIVGKVRNNKGELEILSLPLKEVRLLEVKYLKASNFVLLALGAIVVGFIGYTFGYYHDQSPLSP